MSIQENDGRLTVGMNLKPLQILEAQKARNAINTGAIKAALRFYKNAPDGQYDYDVVVPLLEAVLAERGIE